MKRYLYLLILLLITSTVSATHAQEYRQIVNPTIESKSDADIVIPQVLVGPEWTFVTLTFRSDRQDIPVAESTVLVDDLGNESTLVGSVLKSDSNRYMLKFRTNDIRAEKLTLDQRTTDGFVIKGIKVSQWKVYEPENYPAPPEQITTLDDAIEIVRNDTDGQAESDNIDKGVYIVNCQTYVNLRSGPGATYRVLGQLSSGDVVTVIGDAQGWAEVECGEVTGYVKADYLVAKENNSARTDSYVPGTLMEWVKSKIFILKYFDFPQWAITTMTFVAIIGLALLVVVFFILLFRGMFLYIWMWPLMIFFFQWGFVGPAIVLVLFSWLFLIRGVGKRLLFHLLLWTSLIVSGSFFWVVYDAESSWTALFACGMLVFGSFWFYTSLDRLMMFCKCPNCGYVAKHYILEKELTGTRISKTAISKKVYTGTSSSTESRRLNNETVTDSSGRTYNNHSTDYNVDVTTETDHYIKRRGVRVDTAKDYWYTMQCRSCLDEYSLGDSEYSSKEHY